MGLVQAREVMGPFFGECVYCGGLVAEHTVLFAFVIAAFWVGLCLITCAVTAVYTSTLLQLVFLHTVRF